MFKRILNLRPLLEHRSILLLGPRQVGKSTYLQNEFPESKYYNLLQADTFHELSRNPERIRQSLSSKDKIIIIDEIQKLPSLLDEVQAMMLKNPALRFILTGSSARKLKRGSANLLAGRAHVLRMHPLVYSELNDDIPLLTRLNHGNLPAIINSPLANKDLENYVGTYLKEEILQEALSRGVESFSRFLEVAALANGRQLNFTEIASDTGVPARTIKEYYAILEDTLIGRFLTPFAKTKKRKPVATSRFYFFDIGIVNSLCARGPLQNKSELFGQALEHLIWCEIQAYLDYQQLSLPFHYWRTTSQIEVDFVIGTLVAIEVKSKSKVSKRDYKSLLMLKEEFKNIRTIVVCQESEQLKTDDGVEVFPIKKFLEDLWDHKIIK